MLGMPFALAESMLILASISEAALLTVIIVFCLFMVVAGILLTLAIRETLRGYLKRQTSVPLVAGAHNPQRDN